MTRDDADWNNDSALAEVVGSLAAALETKLRLASTAAAVLLDNRLALDESQRRRFSQTIGRTVDDSLELVADLQLMAGQPPRVSIPSNQRAVREGVAPVTLEPGACREPTLHNFEPLRKHHRHRNGACR